MQEPKAKPATRLVAWRASEGWHIERAQQQEQSTPSVSRDGAPPAGYLASPGWGHIFMNYPTLCCAKDGVSRGA